MRQAQQDLSQMPFMERTLVLKAVTGTTCSVLIHYTNPDLSHYRLLYYFNNPQRSECGEGEVEHCEIHPEVLLAVVQFSLPEGECLLSCEERTELALMLDHAVIYIILCDLRSICLLLLYNSGRILVSLLSGCC